VSTLAPVKDLWRIAALLLAASGCFSAGPLRRDEPEVTGALALAGPTFGERALVPVSCASGEPQVFLGADFAEAEGSQGALVARLVVDPLTGPALRIAAAAAPFAPAIVVRKADCAVFHFSLARTGWRINDYGVYTVSLELDCALPAGDRIAGRLLAPTCW
jgi:hypothetical protein